MNPTVLVCDDDREIAAAVDIYLTAEGYTVLQAHDGMEAIDTVEKRKGKEFISVEEFAACCNKLSKTHIDQLKALGAFAGMADTSQITLF